MKRIFFPIISAVLLIFTSCEPNDEIYDNLDEMQGAYTEDLVFALTHDDYVELSDIANDDNIKEYNSFNDNNTAKEHVPEYLAKTYPTLRGDENKKSTANVTYNHMFSLQEILDTLLSDADYEALGLDTNFFSSLSSAQDMLPNYAAECFPNAAENEKALMAFAYLESSTGVVESSRLMYIFDGTEWVLDESVYVLAAEDYDSMGSPGTFDNFSEDDSPSHYLPIFLNDKFAYAYDGDSKSVVYDYYDDGVKIYYTMYHFHENEGWTYFEVKTDQFIYGTGGAWVFDPTITFSMTAADYQLIANEDPNQDSYGTGGYYYGANAHYVDFDMRISKRREKMPEDYESLDDEQALELMWERLREGLIVLLQKKYPAATPQVDGIDVFYNIKFDVFTEGYFHEYYKITYKCTAASSGSDDPQFEEIEESLIQIDGL